MTSEVFEGGVCTTQSNSHSTKQVNPQKVSAILEGLEIIKQEKSKYLTSCIAFSEKENQHYKLDIITQTDWKLNPMLPRFSRLAKLNHEHLMSMKGVKIITEGSSSSNEKETAYILSEYSVFEDLESLFETESFDFEDEKLVRTCFRQIIEGLSYLHNRGIYHLNLSLKNLILSEDYTIKIGGLEKSYFPGDNDIFVSTNYNYWAPEIFHKETSGSLSPLDIYSAGICLFMLRCGFFPYEVDTALGNNFYKLLINNNQEFWRAHEKLQKRPLGYFSEDFQDLFNSMVHPDPSKRATLDDVINHPWFNKDIYSAEELETQLKCCL